MARSNASVANLALQKLGAARIVALTDDNVNARHVNACFDEIVQQELRDHTWGFAIQRFVLAPSSTTPIGSTDLPFNFAFPLPTGCLRVLLPSRVGLDWTMESIDNVSAIYTNDGNTLKIRAVMWVQDPNRWDALFVEAVACKLAFHLCEAITQSNTKQEKMERQYARAIARARKTDSFESVSIDPPEDVWVNVRRAGAIGSNPTLVFSGAGG